MRAFLMASVFTFLIGQGGVAIPATGDLSDWLKTGLLGLVLAWLMLRHLPEKDKQLEAILKSHREERERAEDKCAEARVAANNIFIEALHKQQIDCNAMLTIMLSARDKQSDAALAVTAASSARITDALVAHASMKS